ncbi:efflux RND transporter periplasmic adaptor subunit [Foetidibacter luteolus]|uniref:efflux RND transporter periplasmic adaptor subunit n=1 Tax=Foetidibacter luteolus TaxID=2608880 RepID=UPI00129BF400|nr:HlyD family efflux transporter periplasmic adaptor subunit [Foetidibacter luteolus]
MDKPIKKKFWNSKRILTIAGVTALLALIVFSYVATSGKIKLNTQADRITVSTIEKGVFQETIPVSGTVFPQSSIYLDALEGGVVEERFVEDGTIVTKGQPILRLSNTDLELNLSNEETEVFNVLTQMQIARNNAQQNTTGKRTQMADINVALKETTRIYKTAKFLYAQGAIGRQEFEQAENNYNYNLERKRLATEILQQDSASNKLQFSQQQASFDHVNNVLKLMKKKVSDLILKAPVEGLLTSLNAEIGQSKNKGERLGQIDVLSGFKVTVDIDQNYLSRVYTGLKGTFSFKDSSYELIIKKVFPQVTNGRFSVDMAFTGTVPKGIRRGQSLQVVLALSDERKALLLARGGFYQQTGGNWIFKLRPDGKSAYKTDIQLGNQNISYFEVLGGLNNGDRVITSSYENYGNIQELILK